MDFGSWRLQFRRGRSSGIWPASNRGTTHWPRFPNPLVFALRPAARVASYDAPSRDGRFSLLPALLYGLAARGWFAETRPRIVCNLQVEPWNLSVVQLRRSSSRRRVPMAAPAWSQTLSQRDLLRRQLP